MAKVYFNDREHLVIKINSKEATKLNFGIPVTGLLNVCLCGTCNNECSSDDIYYIAGINEVMCDKCIDDYVKNMNHYTDEDSLTYEIRHFNYVAEKLDMKERAMITPNGKVVIYDNKNGKIPETSYT